MIQIDRHTQWILDNFKYLGAKSIDVNSIPGDDLSALGAYLNAVGVIDFSAEELTRISSDKKELAAEFGFESFLPPKSWWPRLAAQAIVAQKIRDITRSRIEVKSAWVPEAFSVAEKGTKNSAHTQCCALDLVVASEEAWTKAVDFLLSLYNNKAVHLNLGLGFSKQSKFIHVGCFDARPSTSGLGFDYSETRRRWRYDTSGRPTAWTAINLPE
jgi:hypothetical protein